MARHVQRQRSRGALAARRIGDARIVLTDRYLLHHGVTQDRLIDYPIQELMIQAIAKRCSCVAELLVYYTTPALYEMQMC